MIPVQLKNKQKLFEELRHLVACQYRVPEHMLSEDLEHIISLLKGAKPIKAS